MGGDDFGDLEFLKNAVERYGIVCIEYDVLERTFELSVHGFDGETYGTGKKDGFLTAIMQARLDLDF